MSESQVSEPAGPRAWEVVVGGMRCWVGKSRKGQILGRLFGSLADALIAGDALDDRIADIEGRLEFERWLGLLVVDLKGNATLILWDEQSDSIHKYGYAYDNSDDEVMKSLQEVVNKIERRGALPASTTSLKP